MRELRTFLKNQNKDLHEINGTDILKLEQQQEILSSDDNSLILKENTLLGIFHDEIKKSHGVSYLDKTYHDSVGVEKSINQQFGAVHFFLKPSEGRNMEIYKGEIPEYIKTLDVFFDCVNNHTFLQGFDIKVVEFDDLDMIYDVRNKILNILASHYTF